MAEFELTLEQLPAGMTTLADPGGYILDSLTGALYRLGAFGGIWSPDSSALAHGMCCLTAGFVQILELPSGRSVRIDTGDVFALGWAPDSQRLAAYVSDGDDSHVLVLGRDGRELRRFPLRFAASEIRWLSDSRFAVRANTEGRSGGSEVYYAGDLSSGLIEELFPGPDVTGGDPRILFGEPSPDGNWVAFADREKTYVWERNSGRVVEIVDARAGAMWSKNGAYLLLQFGREGEPFPVTVLLDVASEVVRELPEVGLIASWAAGNSIVHMGNRCGGTRPFDITVTALDGSPPRTLTDTSDIVEYEPSVAPEADMVAFVELQNTTPPRWVLHIRDIDTNVEVFRVIGEDGLHVHEGSWSPDGRFLRFWLGGGHGICD
jgi:Tol biopolymer transport system component